MNRLIAAGAAALMFAGAANAQTVRIATEGAYAPWNFTDENGALAGFEIDLGNAICARAALDCEWVATPWETAIDDLLAGAFDVIMTGVAITEERLEIVTFSEAYYPPEPSYFLMAADRPVDLDDIDDLKLGAQFRTIHADYINANFAGDNAIILYDTVGHAVDDLDAGNLDLVLATGTFLQAIIAPINGRLVLTGPPIALGDGFGAAFRQDEANLIAAFDAAIAAMKADGSLNALIERWFDEPLLFN